MTRKKSNAFSDHLPCWNLHIKCKMVHWNYFITISIVCSVSKFTKLKHCLGKTDVIFFPRYFKNKTQQPTMQTKTCMSGKKTKQLNCFTSNFRLLWEQEWWILNNKYVFKNKVLGQGYLLLLVRKVTTAQPSATEGQVILL